MESPTPNLMIVPGNEDESPPSGLRSVVQKSALLNVVIVLTSFPVLVAAGGPRAVVPTLAIMAAITFLIWTATFTLFSFVSIGRIFWMRSPSRRRGKPLEPAKEAGVADRWLDGPG
jgi:hypothetical protein